MMQELSNKQLEQAIDIAVFGHRGQLDKAGKPYILHPLAIMVTFKNNFEQAVAVLHDVVEDTRYTLSNIMMLVSPEVADAVDSVTKRQGESYEDFIRRAKQHPVGRLIKIADIAHNMSPERLNLLPEQEQKRLREKYARAMAILEEK